MFVSAEEAHQAGMGLLIHCQAGVSRSATIVIAYLMKHTWMTMTDAYKFVKTRRPIISPNLNFMGQLLEFEEDLNNGITPRILTPKLIGVETIVWADTWTRTLTLSFLTSYFERKPLPEVLWSTRAVEPFLNLPWFTSDSLECHGSGSTVMRNAKNPSCWTWPRSRSRHSVWDMGMERERGKMVDRKANGMVKEIRLEWILCLLRSKYRDGLCLQTSGFGHGSACPSNTFKKRMVKSCGVLLFYFYTEACGSWAHRRLSVQ